jgi:hypothetical protein
VCTCECECVCVGMKLYDQSHAKSWAEEKDAASERSITESIAGSERGGAVLDEGRPPSSERRHKGWYTRQSEVCLDVTALNPSVDLEPGLIPTSPARSLSQPELRRRVKNVLEEADLAAVQRGAKLRRLTAVLPPQQHPLHALFSELRCDTLHLEFDGGRATRGRAGL